MRRHEVEFPKGSSPRALAFQRGPLDRPASFARTSPTWPRCRGFGDHHQRARRRVASCTFDEQKGVSAIAKDEIGDRLPIVPGYIAEGSLEAARIAKMARMAARRRPRFPPGPSRWGSVPRCG